LNKVIANIGAKAFFSMLMKHNFVHADCHAGNIMVRIKEAPFELSTKTVDLFERARNYLISQFIKYGFDSEFLRKLSEEHY
jgi:predicted unusual protein kinase regulating ubiquinone biosynthesis (AarF/ABC1/UbiB family)